MWGQEDNVERECMYRALYTDVETGEIMWRESLCTGRYTLMWGEER